ncbi:MAG: hypothetical protein JOY78_20360 [Pseudonocardia sp.]|nr:hypothetical protein [Pseudonocardia sp.]
MSDVAEMPYETPDRSDPVLGDVTATGRICRAIGAMPYGGVVPEGRHVVEAPGLEIDDEEFLHRVADYLEALGARLKIVSETNTEMAHELVELRDQRKAIRDFLGINQLKDLAAVAAAS